MTVSLISCDVEACIPVSEKIDFVGAVVVVILWKLDLKLPMQSMPITTNAVSSNPAQARCTRCNLM